MAIPLGPASPPEKPVLYQRWEDLLFIHWSFDPASIAPHLPPGVRLDTFNGRAWVGIVPFFMRKIRPRGLPALPWLSATPELNLRTYVRDSHDRAGVWFFSLNASNPVAVWTARTFFHLPYYRSAIDVAKHNDVIDYRCRRHGTSARETTRFEYRGTGPARVAERGSLDFFLVERYRLFAWQERRNLLHTARVAHEPYQLQGADLSKWDAKLFTLDGLPAPTGPPEHVCYSAGVAVDIMPLRKLPAPARAALV